MYRRQAVPTHTQHYSLLWMSLNNRIKGQNHICMVECGEACMCESEWVTAGSLFCVVKIGATVQS